MIHMTFLIGGVCCALLCHWMIRHTYTYTLEKTDELDWMRNPKERKIWNKKVTIPRWVYVIIWLFSLLLAPVSIIAPIVVGSFIADACSKGEVHFIYTNKFIEWLKKEV